MTQSDALSVAAPSRKPVVASPSKDGHKAQATVVALDEPVGNSSIFSAVMDALGLWVVVASFGGFVTLAALRPLAAQPAIQNGLVAASLCVGCLALAISAWRVTSARQWWLFSAHVAVIGFLVRLLPNLLLPYPTSGDGYRYFYTFLQMQSDHSLEPAGRYGLASAELHWPVLQLLTLQFHEWTGIATSQLLVLVPPLLGCLTGLAVSLVAYTVFGSWRIAAIAALVAQFTDRVVYYQSEFHPQGLAIVAFCTSLYLVIRLGSRLGVGGTILAMLAAAAFLFTHHASSLILPLALAPLLVLPYVIERIAPLVQRARLSARFKETIESLRGEAAGMHAIGGLVLILVIAGLAMQVYFWGLILTLVARWLDPAVPAASPHWINKSPLLWIQLLRLPKYLVLLGSAVGIIIALRKVTLVRLALVLVVVTLDVAGFASAAGGSTGTDRVFGFWSVFAGILLALALIAMAQFPKALPKLGLALSLAVVAVLMGTGVLDSQDPPYFFTSLPRSAGTFYGNRLPPVGQIANASRWFAHHSPAGAIVGTDIATRPMVFFFGHQNIGAILFSEYNAPKEFCRARYLVVDPSLERGDFMPFPIPIEFKSYYRIYDNGNVVIYQRPATTSCKINPSVGLAQ